MTNYGGAWNLLTLELGEGIYSKGIVSGRLQYTYHSVPQICPPSHISPPYIFSQSTCTGIFISHIGPSNHIYSHATKIATWSSSSSSSKLLHCEVQGLCGGVSMQEQSKCPQNSCHWSQACSRVASMLQHIERTNSWSAYSYFRRMKEDWCWTGFYWSVI